MNRTSISWADMVWNPITGCTPVSAGCANCYAAAIAKRFWKSRKFADIQFHSDRMLQPLRMRKSKQIFVNSMSDLFHEKVNIDDILNIHHVMETCPQHRFLILTKRPYRMRDFTALCSWPSWVWLGVSVENQETANERLPVLLETPCYTRFVSVEPMLEPVDLTPWLPKLNWVICGAESGPNCRPFQAEWAADLYRQSKAAGVPFFGKQDSGPRPGKPLLINGQTVQEFPFGGLND